MKNIEILAPAGSYESLIGAVHAGCDAVYLGGTKFGARAFANNLSEEDMLRAIDYVHLHNKQLYLTINTLLHTEEIEEELYNYLKNYYKQGLDAVIVQDVGVLSFVHKNFPQLPIHASTQMTLTHSAGTKCLENYGVTRFVTSRELNLEEIRKIRKETFLEIEAFVHGALCYCYSGQCYFSSLLGDRSGNRGRCAQPCRLPYEVSCRKDNIEDSQKDYTSRTRKINPSTPYALSPKDICTLDIIPELIEAGINSFKIEGRMKSSAYSSLTAQIYRKYADLYFSLGKEDYKQYIKTHKKEYLFDYQCLMDLYNRGGFTNGYYKNYNGSSMMSMKRPNHSGVLVGRVTKIKGNQAYYELISDVYAQDVVEFRDNEEQCVYEYTIKNGVKKQTSSNTIMEAKFKPGSKIKVGQEVYRTKRNTLLNTIKEETIDIEPKIKINGFFSTEIEQPISLTLTTAEALPHSIFITATGEIAEQAKNQPITSDAIKKQLCKLNHTSFAMEHLEIEIKGDVFIPVGHLNELRRKATEQLETEICNRYRRDLEKKLIQEKENNLALTKKKSPYKSGLSVSVQNLSQLDVILKFKQVNQVYLDMHAETEEHILSAIEKISSTGKSCYIRLPYILRRKDFEIYEKALQDSYINKNDHNPLGNILSHEHIKGFIIKNLEELSLLQKYRSFMPEKELILDYNMYTFNQQAKEFWDLQGVSHTTVSIELNKSEIKKNGCQDQDMLVYGHLPFMTSVQCLTKNLIECKNANASVKQNSLLYLKNKKSNHEHFAVNYCKYCYNIIYNNIPLSLHEELTDILELAPKNIRLDFTIETSEEVCEVLNFYSQLYEKQHELPFEFPIKNFTKGHFKKGVK